MSERTVHVNLNGSNPRTGSDVDSVWESDYNISRPASPANSAATENYGRYVPPHKRRPKLDMGDEVVIQSSDPEKQDVPGVENRKYARLLHRTGIATGKTTTQYVSQQFPGLFLVPVGHENHPHPTAHILSDVVQRFKLRRLPPGSKILQIGGIPKYAAWFNRMQAQSNQGAKHMTCLVDLYTPDDFLRCINKWGPRYTIDDVSGEVNENYLKGHIRDLSPEKLREFDVFIFHHTGYYHTFEDYMHIVRSNENARIIITTLKHDQKEGFLNNGEQRYISLPSKKHGYEIVQQTNLIDKGTYCHPNIFKQFHKDTNSQRRYRQPDSDLGLTWEMVPDCDDHWTIEMNSFKQSLLSKVVQNDWDADFAEALLDDVSDNKWVQQPKGAPITVIPTTSGRFLELEVPNLELVERLRVYASGRSRVGKDGQQLLVQMFQNAKTMIQPGSLFPGQTALECKPHLIADHVMSAFITDVEREMQTFDTLSGLRSICMEHNRALSGTMPKITKKSSAAEILLVLREIGKVGLQLGAVVATPGSTAKAMRAIADVL